MKARFLALSLALAPFAGCNNGNTDFWQPRNNLLPMVALDDHVAFVERNTQTAFLLDPADPSLTPRMMAVGKAPVVALKRNANASNPNNVIPHNQLLVLSMGDHGSTDIPAVPADLRVIDANPAVAPGIYPLTGRFDGLAQSDDGRFLVLYHSPSGQAQVDSSLYDPNEMVIVDFTTAEGAAPLLTGKSIRSLGYVPNTILFSPPYVFGGIPRTLAVVLSQNYITIMDLEHPNNTEISVPLCPTSTNCTLSPVQILFDPANQKIYVRASGSMDIFQIALTDVSGAVPPPTAPDNDFVASLSMLAVGANPADMVLFGSGVGTRIAAVSADARRLVIIDPSNSHATIIATSIPANQIIRFSVPGNLPTDKPKERALLVDRLLQSTSVLFADLEQVETTGGLAITDYPLPAPAGAVYPLMDAQQRVAEVVMVSSKFAGNNAAVTVVDLATASVSAIGAGATQANPTIETRNPSRLWSVDHGNVLSFLNLMARPSEPRLMTGETPLDQNITNIVPLSTPSLNGTRYLIVAHNDPDAIGNFTVLDADHPDRTTARTGYGFLFTDYLKREQP